MSEKLRNALTELQQSVDNFERNYQIKEKQMNGSRSNLLGQHDLFGLSQDPIHQQNAKAMAAVLDRTIMRMEKLVGEKA